MQPFHFKSKTFLYENIRYVIKTVKTRVNILDLKRHQKQDYYILNHLLSVTLWLSDFIDTEGEESASVLSLIKSALMFFSLF